MNERILQLWSQAEEEIKAEYEDESRRNRRLYNEIFLPKFAQLIVRDCMDIAKNWDEQLVNSELYKESNAVGIVVYRIARQFGVKE